MVQVAVRGFQPSSLFKAQSHYKDEKYHVLGAGNYYSWRYQGGNRVIQGLDHHSDHGGDFGWSLHAIPHPGVKKGDENDFKLLAYRIKDDGRYKNEQYNELFTYQFLNRHIAWDEPGGYLLQVEWKPNGDRGWLISLRRAKKGRIQISSA